MHQGKKPRVVVADTTSIAIFVQPILVFDVYGVRIELLDGIGHRLPPILPSHTEGQDAFALPLGVADDKDLSLWISLLNKLPSLFDERADAA